MKSLSRLFSVACALLILLSNGWQGALAHPHVWVKAQSTVQFDNDLVVSIRHAWTFDEGFSAFATQGLDTDGDGSFSREELHDLAVVNVTSLKEFEFFTFVTDGEDAVSLLDPIDYWLEYDKGLLTLFFTLPLAKPEAVDGELVVDVYDSTYFVDFGFADTQHQMIAGRDDCQARLVRPKDLPVDIADRLAALSPDVRELPDELKPYAEAYSNGIHVTCS